MVGGRFIDCQEAGAPRLESGRGKKTNKKQKRNQEKIKQSQPKPFGRRETGQSGRKVVGPADGNRATLFLFRRFLRFWLDRLSLGLQPWNRHFEVFVFVYSLFFGVATLGWFSFFLLPDLFDGFRDPLIAFRLWIVRRPRRAARTARRPRRRRRARLMHRRGR